MEEYFFHDVPSTEGSIVNGSNLSDSNACENSVFTGGYLGATWA